MRQKVSIHEEKMYKKETISPFIIQCMIMRMSEKDALSYLKDRGFKISRPQFYRLKKEIQDSRFDRLNLIGKSQFVDQHLERIDQLELINQEMWSLYRKEKDTFKQAQILMQIADLQTYISPYYEASKWVMEHSIKQDDKEQQKKDTISDSK